MPAVQAMHQAQRQEGLPFQVVGPQCVMVQHHEQEAHPVLLAHLSRHQEFKGLIKQRVKVLLVPSGLPESQLGEFMPGLQGQMDKKVAGAIGLQKQQVGGAEQLHMQLLLRGPVGSSQRTALCSLLIFKYFMTPFN